MSETTALGAAFLAGLAAGFWKDEFQLEDCRKTDAVFSPRLNTRERTRLISEWRKAVSKVIYKGTL
jgi:glycerol kinase